MKRGKGSQPGAAETRSHPAPTPPGRPTTARIAGAASRDQIRRVEPQTTLGEWCDVVDSDRRLAAPAADPTIAVEHGLTDLAPLGVVATLGC
jgi:hypothetical protein